MIQKNNAGARVAIQTLAQQRDLSVFYSSIPDLASQLRETDRMTRIRDSVWRQRDRFTFDAHADELIAFFRSVIATASSRYRRSGATTGVTKPSARSSSPNGIPALPPRQTVPAS
jgi:hypothetical protein